jgi:PAS domain S-box-containing protein
MNSQRKLLSLLRKVSLAIGEAETSEIAFQQVLTHICEFMEWPLGHVYVWSDSAQSLVSSGIWYVAEGYHFKPFRELSERTRFEPGQGTVGRVIASGKPVNVLDVRSDAGFVRQLPVDEGGIRAYFSFPVMVGDQVQAVIEFFSPESGAPDADMTLIISHAGALLGLAVQKEEVVAHLRQSEARLAEAQHTAHIAHWEWDIAKDAVNWSSELYRIFGVKPDAFAASYEAFLSYVHPDDLAFVKEKVGQAVSTGQSFNYFHRIVRPDGVVRVIHARGRPLYDDARKIIKLYGTAQDMTELRETELELAQRVRQLSTLIEIGQTVAGTLDLEQIYDRVFSLLKPLVGAQTLLLLLHEDDALRIAAVDQDATADDHGKQFLASSGIIGEAWRSKQTLHVWGDECAEQSSADLREVTGYQPQAIITAPLCVHDECLGVLAAVHEAADAFDDADMRLIEASALWTAIAIDNARQYAQLRRRLHETDAIVAISNAMVETLELDEVLQLIVQSVKDIVTHADWTTIHLLHPQRERLELAASAGLDIKAADYTLGLNEGIAGQVMVRGETINIADVQEDPRRVPIDHSTQARSLLVAPVESRHRRLGTISVQCATPSAFSEEDERLLKILGIQAGIAIDNARLYDEQRRAKVRAELQSKRIRRMARRVVEAQEQERARISRELHDEAGQALTALQIGLELTRAQLPDELEGEKAGLQELVDLADETLSNLRRISHNLRPPGLDAYGLHAALAGLCEDFSKHTSLAISYEGKDIAGLAPLVALSLYRFAQESLTNAAKHAGAGEVEVKLDQTSDTIILMVKDNGEGFEPPDWDADLPPEGTGLIGMLERLEMVDGRLEISSAPGRGTELTAVVPYGNN